MIDVEEVPKFQPTRVVEPVSKSGIDMFKKFYNE